MQGVSIQDRVVPIQNLAFSVAATNWTGLFNVSDCNTRLSTAPSLTTLRFSLFSYRRNLRSHSSTPGVSRNFSRN